MDRSVMISLRSGETERFFIRLRLPGGGARSSVPAFGKGAFSAENEQEVAIARDVQPEVRLPPKGKGRRLRIGSRKL
jgi:hypothetical protein